MKSGIGWSGRLGDAINSLGGLCSSVPLDGFAPRSAAEQSAYDKWLDQTSTREEARLDRVHGAVGVIPVPLWIVLFFIAAVIFVYMLFFADSGEGPVTQGMLMGSVTAVIVVVLLLLSFLDSPFRSDVGGLRPAAMERTLRIVDEALAATGRQVPFPCDAEGLGVERPQARRVGVTGYGVGGAGAAGGRAIDARRLTSGVSGTRTNPRVGRSRSKVMRRSTVTNAAARTTVTIPLARIAR